MASDPVLPTDIFRLIIGYLNPLEVHSARLICKEFYALSKLRSVWIVLLHRHALHHNIPIPGLQDKTLNSLSASDLERHLFRALKARNNWIADSPTIKRRYNMDGIDGHRVVSVRFLQNGKLLSYSVSQHFPRTAFLQCWDIEASPPRCIAKRELRSRGMAVDITSPTVRIAVTQHKKVNILSLDTQATEPDNAFKSEAVEGEVNSVHFFQGMSLITGDDHDRLFFWELSRPEIKIQLQNTSEQDLLVRDVVVTQDFVLLLRTKTLELYINPSSMISSANTSSSIQPVYVYEWPWRIDIGLMSSRHQPNNRRDTASGVFIVMRYGSYFPWSINLLHHYELRPNPIYSRSSPISAINLPYDFPPVLQDTIASPVRLHSISDLAIGPYGTAIWTDSHTEDYFNRADQGQRLAGKFFPYSGGQEEEVELSDQVATAAATSVYAYHEEESWAAIALDETESRIALGRDDGLITVLEFA